MGPLDNSKESNIVTRVILEINYLEKFMLESNSIEGEDYLNPSDIIVAKEVIEKGIKNLKHLQKLHSIITKHLQVSWGGKWRTVNVKVGSYKPPLWQEVPELMLMYWSNFDHMDSWQAHNEFEHIHPFQDFNGRMGRLIWLSKAIKEGYNFRYPFLQKYYYQTLNNFRR
jgi:Fic family protein